MVSKSKVLVIGGTGYIGQHIALASAAQGHPTFVLVRPSSLISSKVSLISSFKLAGITILEGSLEDYDSLVAAIKQVDVVISAVGLDELKIIEAIKEVGTIKRFVPSEFGNDCDRVKALEPVSRVFEERAKLRRAIEDAGIPHTYVVANCFAGYSMSNLMQLGLPSPPRDKVSIYGSGDVKSAITVICNSEEDIGAYTIMAVDDPRTLNKVLHIRPAANIVTMNSMVELWEKLICKTLEKVYVTPEDMVKQIQGPPFPDQFLLAVLHDIVILGDQCNFELGAKDVEATTLYPDHRYISTEEYIAKFV